MEAFSLLKYWRGGGGGGGGLPPPSSAADTTATTAILTAVAQNDTDTDDDNDSNGDDGPFFDLEFTVPDEPDDSEDGHENPNDNHSAHHSEEEEEEEEEENDDVAVDDDNNEECEGDREFKFTLSPSTSNERSDPNLSVSDDLFFKGKLVHLDLNSSEPSSKPQSSLLKSATKFRVFMLGLKKSKSNIISSSSSHKHKESNASDSVAPNPKKQQQRKLFTVKFKVEEVPIMSLFTRDNKASQNKKHNTEEEIQSPSSASDEKRLHKYLKMVKPLYVRVSRRYAEKLRFSGQLNITSSSKAPAPAPAPAEKEKEKEKAETDASETANVKGQKQGNLALPAGLRVVCKHLGKSRSASSAPAAVASAPAPAPLASSRRRDDSLLQQQDGIQGAILHCKRSFNASRGCESSQLPRSVSDPLHEISPELSRKSTNEGKNKRL